MNRNLDDLLARASAALRGLPGAGALYLFGSAADPDRKDACSDLDLQLVTERPDLSRAALFQVMSRIGEISLVLRLQAEESGAEEAAFTVGFTGESPFHKLDLGLTPREFPGGLRGEMHAKTLLWEQSPSSEMPPTASISAWFPEWGTPEHFLLGELLSAVRYVKARRRGQHLTCWRFLSAKFNALLRCYRWDRNPACFPPQALSTWDFADLDRCLPAQERLDWLAALQIGTPQAMDRSLLALTRRIAVQIFPNYPSGETRAAALVREYLDFISNELGE